jgi:ubiquinone/menaquinone biosynthesis C-methylase UbiE
MSFKENIHGVGREKMPAIAFRMMDFIMKVHDLFKKPQGLLDEFGIKEGGTVVDYGCGPARFIVKAAALVGPKGRVYAADVHQLAIEAVAKAIRKYGLKNVEAVLTEGYDSGIPDGAADVVYALDMFHMIADPDGLLKELNRITKPDGFLFIDDGHKPRKETREKIAASGRWELAVEKERYLKYRPMKSRQET